MINEQDLLSKFQKVKRVGGDKWRCLCPLPEHQDKNPSFSISRNSSGWGLYCFSCGRVANRVCEYLGIPLTELSADFTPKPKGKNRTIGKYDYIDIQDGEYLYTKFRFADSKRKYGIKVLDKDGKTVTNRKPRDKFGIYTPFCLDTIRKAETICYCEGEKDCLTLAKAGLISFTCGGCRDWRSEFAELMRDKTVYVFRDNDNPSAKMGEQILKDTEGIVKEIYIVNPVPDVPKADISDFKGNIFDLLASVKQTDKPKSITEILKDERVRSLKPKPQLLYLYARYLVSDADPEPTDKTGQIHLNRELLAGLGLYSRNDREALYGNKKRGKTGDIQKLIDAGLITEIHHGGNGDKGSSVYELVKL